MRIALVTETFLPKVDGIVSVVCRMADYLQVQGHDVVIVAPRAKAIHDYRSIPIIGVSSIRNPLYDDPQARVGIPSPVTFLALRRFNPDVVHLLHPVAIGLPTYLMARSLRKPIVVSFHLDLARISSEYRQGYLRPMIDWLTRLVFNRADAALAPSRYIQQRLREVGVTREITLWKRGVDTERFHPRQRSTSTREQLAHDPCTTLLLYVGRLSKEKRVSDLRVIFDHMPDVALAIVGDGPERESLETSFANTPTHFFGHLSGEELARWYASADIFVFPSAMETYGLVITEALASGLPVVASQTGAAQELVPDAVRGFTFPVGDTQKMVSNIQTIIKQVDLQQMMKVEARSFAETLSWGASMQQIEAVYAELVASKRR